MAQKNNKNEKPKSIYRKTTELERRYPRLAETGFRKVVMLHALEEKAADKTRRNKPKASGVTTIIKKLLPKHFPEIKQNGMTELDVKNYQKVCNTLFLKTRNIDQDFLKYKSILPDLFPTDEFSQTEILFDAVKTTPVFPVEEIKTVVQAEDTEKIALVRTLKECGVKQYKDTEYGFEIQF